MRRPSWFAVLLTLAGMIFFVRLGVWQLHRAAYKEVLLTRFQQAAHAPLEEFGRVANHPPASRYPHVRVRGRFLAQRIYFLDDQTRAGRVGVQVFVAFRPADRNRILLVDQGFLPRQGVGRALPQLPPLPDDRVRITGMYAPPPSAGLRLGGNALTQQETWPKLTTYLDLDQVGQDLDRAIYPRVLLADADPATPYVRVWTPGFMPPARHRGYAFTWFSFALAALLLFLWMHREPEPDTAAQDSP